jgi:hypothetical protein
VARTGEPIIELAQVVRDLLAEVSTEEVADHVPGLRHLLDRQRDWPNQFTRGHGGYVVLPFARPLPEATLAWHKHEFAVVQVDRAMCNGDLPAWLTPPTEAAISGTPRIQLLRSQWAAYDRNHRHQMIRAGAILASAGDALMPCDPWFIVFELEAATAWRAKLARERRPSELACKVWLEGLMRTNPERSPELKPELRKEAKDRFRVSAGQFNKLYTDGLRNTGAKWGAGRRSKN